MEVGPQPQDFGSQFVLIYQTVLVSLMISLSWISYHNTDGNTNVFSAKEFKNVRMSLR
jgi:hypothetical protein